MGFSGQEQEALGRLDHQTTGLFPTGAYYWPIKKLNLLLVNDFIKEIDKVEPKLRKSGPKKVVHQVGTRVK